MVGIVPYIALQLKGIVLGVNLLSGINIEAAALIIIALSLLPGVIHVLKEPERRAHIKRQLRTAHHKLRRKG